MVVIRQNSCIRAAEFVFGQKWLYSSKSGCFWVILAVFGQAACIWAQTWLYSCQEWLYSRKSGCIRAKWYVFGQKWNSRRVVVFGQSGCNSSKLLYSGRSVCIRAKVVVFGDKWLYLSQMWLYSGKSSCISGKRVVFGLRWLYSGKVVVFGQSGCIWAKWL